MASSHTTKLAAYLRTDVGVVREHNEDSAYADPEGMYFVVADGMGGHAAGEVASSLAVEDVKTLLSAARERVAKYAHAPADEARGEVVKLLEQTVKQAHKTVSECGARDADKRGMGTTLEVVLVSGDEAFVAHVGDSRTYLLRGAKAARVTTDHTVAEVLVIEGKLTAEEARMSPLRTILVNAIGVSEDVGVELAHLKLRRGDKILLCSDGLHDYFPEDGELAELLGQMGGEDGLAHVVELAKQRGGHDNITGVLVEVIEGNPALDDIESIGPRAQELAAQDASDEKEAVPRQMLVEPTAPVVTLPVPGDGDHDRAHLGRADTEREVSDDTVRGRGVVREPDSARRDKPETKKTIPGTPGAKSAAQRKTKRRKKKL